MSYHQYWVLVIPPLLFSAVDFFFLKKCHGHWASPPARGVLATQGGSNEFGEAKECHLELALPALSSALAWGEQQQQLQKTSQDLVPLTAAAATTAVPGCVPALCLPQFGKLAQTK